MMTSDLTLNNTSPPAFPSSSGFHPLSSSPATNVFFQTGMAVPLTEDVTTIFVVGFPDDMTEREFQNMFMFCPGFEAASLKWHCKDQEDDNSVGSNGGKKQMIGFARFHTRLEAMEAVDILGGKKVDQDKGTVLKAEMAKKNLHVKRGSVAPITNTLLSPATTNLLQHQQPSSGLSLTTPMIPGEISSSSTTTTSTAMTTETTTTTTNSDLGMDASVMTATVDPASTVTSTTPNSSTPTSSLGGRNSMVGEGTMSLLSKKLGRYPTSSTSSSSANGSYDAFSPLPSDLLSPADYKTDPFLNDPFTTCATTTPSTPVFADSLFRNIRSNSFDERPASSEINFMSPPRHPHPSPFGGNSSGAAGGMMGFSQNAQGNGFMMGSSPLAKSSSFNNIGHHPLQQSHHPLQQLHHHPYQPTTPTTSSSPFSFNNNNNNNNSLTDDDSYDYLSKSTPVSNDRLFGTSPLFDDLIMANRMGSLTMQANNAAATLTDVRSPSVPSIHQHRPSINPADQNPPCNTLYVGNLPPNTNEDELRQLFSTCRGYKRMCFRNKPQGPMCFVEFDDVVLAKHALNEHQGAHLTNSVKGGIRLSYSKNPLFIKGGTNSPGANGSGGGGGSGSPAPFFNGKTTSAFDTVIS